MTNPFSEIEIARLSKHLLSAAYEQADASATDAGRSAGGWVRLAKIQGSEPKPYVIAIRKVGTPRGFQFGCGCKDWIFRQQKTGNLCKHQRAFLAAGGTKPGSLWMFNAGASFIRAMAAELGMKTEIMGDEK